MHGPLTYKVRFILSLVIGLCCFYVTQSVSQIPLLHIGPEQGLKNLVINEITKGPQGFIWIATNAGLKKYDGEHITNIESGLYSYISQSQIVDILIHNDILYMSIQNRGLYTYNLVNNSINKIEISVNGLEVTKVNHINMIADDLLLSLDLDGIIRVSSDTTLVYGMGSVPMTINIGDSLILATPNGAGMRKVKPDFHGETELIMRTIDHDLTSNYTCDISVVLDGHIWLACWDNALHKLSTNNYSVESFLLPQEVKFSNSSDEIVALAKWRKKLVVGTKFGLLYSYDQVNNEFLELDNSFVENRSIQCFYVDEDKLWIGTSLGVVVIDLDEPCFHLTALNSNQSYPVQVNIMLLTRQKLFLGTNSGVVLFDKGSLIQLNESIMGESIHSLISHKSIIYIGSNKSVYSYQSNKLKNEFDVEIVRAYPNYFDPKEIQFSRYSSLAIQETKFGDVLWAIPFGHFITYKPLNEGWASYSEYYNDVKENLANRLVVDEYDRLHILAKLYGWYDNVKIHHEFCSGLPFFENLTFKTQNELEFSGLMAENVWHLNSKYPLPTNDVRTLNHFQDKTFLGTATGLIEIASDSSMIHHSLPLNDIRECILWKDKLWIVSNGKLLSFDPSNRKARLYGEKEGLGSEVVINTLTSGQDTLYIAGNGFLAKASYSDLIMEEEINTDLRMIFAKKLNTGERISIQNNTILSHEKDKGLHLRFATILLPDASEVKYSYQMPDITDGWIDNDNNNEVILPNLVSGEHSILIRAMNFTNDQLGEILQINIIVQPYWYKAWWFFSLGLLVILLLLIWTYRWRVNNLLAITMVRNDISHDLHDDVGSILSSISIYADAAESALDNENRVSTKNILGIIGDQARVTIERMSDIVWSFHADRDTLNDLFERMELHGNTICQIAGIEFIYVNSLHENEKIDMKRRKNIYLIYKEFIQNSLKHSKASVIELSVKLQSSKIQIVITDNGIGFNLNSNNHSGFGLLTMRSRADEIGAQLSISSSIGKGSELLLII